MFSRPILFIACLLSLCTTILCRGEEVFLEPERFIEDSFEGTPSEEVIWLNKELKEDLGGILGHPFKGLRVRYWRAGERTAWILEEIGKVELITAGFVVEEDTLQRMEVLIYRESHGWEVRYPFFTRQFKGLQLDHKKQLNKDIDGISGATMSVEALNRLTRVALYLHGKVVH